MLAKWCVNFFLTCHQLLGVHLPMVEGHVRMLRLIQENAAGGSRDWNIVTAMLNRGNAMLDDVKNASRLMVNFKPLQSLLLS